LLMQIKQNDNWLKYLVPKEHGAWAMWLLPFIIGVAAAAGDTTSGTWHLLAACLLIFGARTALGSAIRMRRRNQPVFIKCVVAGALECLLALICLWPLVSNASASLITVGAVVLILLTLDLLWIKDRSDAQ